MKRLLYGIAVAVLAVSLVISFVSYKRAHYYKEEAGIYAVGVFDFAKRLHYADDEHPLHFEGGEHPFYEKTSESSEYFNAYTFYQRCCIASIIIGTLLALILFYYAHTRPDSKLTLKNEGSKTAQE